MLSGEVEESGTSQREPNQQQIWPLSWKIGSVGAGNVDAVVWGT